jgi:isopenicillin-N epimerase
MLPGADELWADLDPTVSHCNHGSYGAVPRPVRLAQDEFRRRAETNPNEWHRFTLPPLVEAARLHMAKFVGATADNAVFVENATSGVNVALAAVGLRDGEGVVITDHAYGAIARTARRATDRVGGETTIAAIDLVDDVDAHVAAFIAASDERTRVAIIDHIASPTGLVLPVAAIVAALRERGIVTIVDAAHAPGSTPLAVDALGADFWTGNFHKWPSAPRPCAALVMNNGWQERTEPLVASFGLESGVPESFAWHGTADYSSVLCLQESIERLRAFGWDTLRAHNDTLAAWAGDLVADALGTAPALPKTARTSMSLIPLPAGYAETDESARDFIGRVSRELGVEVAANPFRGQGYLRLSAHAYNDESDYEKLAKGLPGLLGR